MSSTTVHSNNSKKGTATVAGYTFKPTEKTLEVPPKGKVFEVISSYIEEQGNMEIPVGNAKVYENGILEIEGKETEPKAMKNKDAYLLIDLRRKDKKKLEVEAKEKSKRKVAKSETGIDR